MPTGLLLCLALILPAPALSGWETLPSGLAYRAVHYVPAGATLPVTVHAFRLSLDDFELRVLPAPRGTGARLDALAAGSGALLVVNGGYFTAAFEPLGLLVSEGRELNSLRKADWGVFSVAGGRARLVHRRRWHPPAALEFAIEAGPRLVTPGRRFTFKLQSAERTGLGILPDGRVVVAATDGVLLLADWATLFDRPEADGGLGCRWALNLDGGSSTQLRLRDGDRRLDLPGRAPVANAIGVFPRVRAPGRD